MVDDLVEVDSDIYKYIYISDSVTIAVVTKGQRDWSPLVSSWLRSVGS